MARQGAKRGLQRRRRQETRVRRLQTTHRALRESVRAHGRGTPVVHQAHQPRATRGDQQHPRFPARADRAVPEQPARDASDYLPVPARAERVQLFREDRRGQRAVADGRGVRDEARGVLRERDRDGSRDERAAAVPAVDVELTADNLDGAAHSASENSNEGRRKLDPDGAASVTQPRRDLRRRVRRDDVRGDRGELPRRVRASTREQAVVSVPAR
mmetsp:Transcript_1485/g.4963  ORF Transcript_1485/g.4963 Transcript_1485/m.4963 type:complete len:215 (+) Transcript_1485:892-1536(+)